MIFQLKIMLASFKKNKVWYLVISLTMMLTVAVMIASGNIAGNAISYRDHQFRKNSLNSQIIIKKQLNEDEDFYFLYDEELINKIRNIDGISNVIVRTGGNAFDKSNDEYVNIIGTDMKKQNEVLNFSLKQSSSYLFEKPDALLVNEKYALEWNIKVGDNLVLYSGENDTKFVVDGICTNEGVFSPGVNSFVGDLSTVQKLIGKENEIYSIGITVDELSEIGDILIKLNQLLPNELEAEQTYDLDYFKSYVETVKLSILLVASVFFVVLIYIIYQVQHLVINEKERQNRLLWLNGISKKVIRQEILLENISLTLFSVIVGDLLSLLIIQLTYNALGVKTAAAISIESVLLIDAIVLICTFVSSEFIYFNNKTRHKRVFAENGETLFSDEKYLYQLGSNGSTATPLLEWLDVGIKAKDVTYAARKGGSDGLLIATNEAGRITIYSVILGDRANDRMELTFACVGMNESLLQCIYEYNATQSDCWIYAKDFSVQEDPYTALNLSLISGDVYDLICVNELPIQDYVRKGILADLAQFVDPAEFFQPYVKAVSIDGKMYQVSPDFVVYTIVGDKKSVGEQKGWNHKEFLEYLRKNEEHVTLGYADKQDLLRITCQNAMDDFLVREPGKAGIDERKMSETLQFVMEYQGPSADKYYQEGYQFLDVAHLEPTFLAETVLSSVGSYRILKDAYSGRLVAKGYPVEEGAGTYVGLGTSLAIGAKSAHKKEAWEFIKFFLDRENQITDKMVSSFPTRNEALQAYISTERNQEPISSWSNGQTKEIKGYSEADRKELLQILESIQGLRPDNSELYAIVREETDGFFNAQVSLERTLRALDERIRLYLNENQ